MRKQRTSCHFNFDRSDPEANEALEYLNGEGLKQYGSRVRVVIKALLALKNAASEEARLSILGRNLAAHICENLLADPRMREIRYLSQIPDVPGTDTDPDSISVSDSIKTHKTSSTAEEDEINIADTDSLDVEWDIMGGET